MAERIDDTSIGHNRTSEFYCATYIRDNDELSSAGVTVCSDIEDVRKILDDDVSEGLADRPTLMSTSSGAESDLELDLSHFFQSLQKYYELANVSENISPVLLRGYFNRHIDQFITDKLIAVETYKGSVIYALDLDLKTDLDRRVNKWADMKAGMASLAPSILLGLVASYDSLFAQLFSQILLLRPERYNNSERQLTVSEILRLSSFEDVLHKVVSDEIESVTSKSHMDQIQVFEKSFTINVRETFSGWGEFIEVFERRNLAAHGNLLIDEKYITNCKKAGLKLSNAAIGDELIVDEEYLTHSIDVLVDLGTRLVFAAWHKQVPADRENAYGAVVNLTFEFIKARRYELADSVADFVINQFSAAGQDKSLKAIVINRAIALKKMKKEKESKSFLETTDWTAASPIYNLCVAGVIEDVETAIRLLPIVKAMQELGPVEVRTWPAFDWIRTNGDFGAAFERVFDEPLMQATAIEEVSVEPTAE